MKIVSWNTSGAFRNKFRKLMELDADVYVVIECENPKFVKDSEFHKIVDNRIWYGGSDHKGLMIFSPKSDITIERLDWGDSSYRYFLPVRINNNIKLVGAWACNPYCAELFDWLKSVEHHLSKDTIIIGDLNSSAVFDRKYKNSNKGKRFSDCLSLLGKHGIEGIWHHHKKEEHGHESCPTFYLYRHLDRGYHIDHCLASPDIVKSIAINARWQWLQLSDHLPLEIIV